MSWLTAEEPRCTERDDDLTLLSRPRGRDPGGFARVPGDDEFIPLPEN